MAEGPVRVSLIIPTFNEADRIGGTLEAVQAYFVRQGYAFEVIVVDDGSTDGTSEAVRSRFPDVKVIAYPRNRGKGYAMRRGVVEAAGAVRIVYDADGSTPIEEVGRLWPEFEKGAAVVIGSRALPDSDVRVRQPKYRRAMGRIFNWLLRALRLTTFRDTQCGFKAFTAASCDVIFPRLTMNGFGSDCEMLYLARVHGLPVVQVPVTWINSPVSRVNPVLDSFAIPLPLRHRPKSGHSTRSGRGADL